MKLRQANTGGDGVKDGAEVKHGNDFKEPPSTLPQNLAEIPRWRIRVVPVDSQELSAHDGRSQNVIDGHNKMIWHTEWSAKSPKHPHEMVIWLGSDDTMGGFTYLPRQDGSLNGTVAKYYFYAVRRMLASSPPV
jgi:hypothetical protein